MAEILGITSSIITILEAAKLIQRSFSGIKEASLELSNTREFVDFVKFTVNTLKRLQGALEERSSEYLQAPEKEILNSIKQLLQTCERDLEILHQIISPKIAAIARKQPWMLFKRRRAASATILSREDHRIRRRLEERMKYLQTSVELLLLTKSLVDPEHRDHAVGEVRKLPSQLCRNDGNDSIFEEGDGDLGAIRAMRESAFKLTSTIEIESRPERPITHAPRETCGGISNYSDQAELEIRLEIEKELVEHFTSLLWYYEASIYQKKAIETRKQLSRDHGVDFSAPKRAEMDLGLADILLAVEIPSTVQEARGILEKLSQATVLEELQSDQRHEFLFKLGKIFVDLNWRLEEAAEKLRQAYNGFLEKEPRSNYLSRIHEIVRLVSKAHRALGEIHRAYSWEAKVQRDLKQDFVAPPNTLELKIQHWLESRGLDATVRVPYDLLRNPQGNSALHEAAQDPRIDSDVLSAVLSNSHNFECLDSNGETPLFLAVAASNHTTVKMLLDFGSNVHVTGKNEQTPLHKCQDPEIAKSLLEKMEQSRNFEIANTSRATIDSQDSYGKSPLHRACTAGNVAMVQRLLTKKANTELKCIGDGTPLMCAATANICKDKKRALVQALVAHGANTNVENENGQTPLKALTKTFEPADAKRLLRPSRL